MRFARMARPEAGARGITPRRLAASKKWIAKELDKAGLFAEEVAAELPTPEDRITDHDASVVQGIAERRQWQADRWRAVRAKLFAYPDAERAKILAAWQYSNVPGDPAYFGEFLQSWEKNREFRNAPVSAVERSYLAQMNDWRRADSFPRQDWEVFYNMLRRGLIEKDVDADGRSLIYRAVERTSMIDVPVFQIGLFDFAGADHAG